MKDICHFRDNSLNSYVLVFPHSCGAFFIISNACPLWLKRVAMNFFSMWGMEAVHKSAVFLSPEVSFPPCLVGVHSSKNQISV